MKQLLLLLSFSPLFCLSQKTLKEYKASNGITYHKHDTIKLGQGSMPNGDFKHLQMGGWAAIVYASPNGGSNQYNIGKRYSGQNVIISAIKSYTRKGATQVWFSVKAGNISNYNLYIEDAIADCEIKNCNKEDVSDHTSSLADELKKLKTLLDNGALTQEEYDIAKKKLLSEN